MKSGKEINMNYDAMYQNKDLWEKNQHDELVRSKIPIILDWIPSDVKTILDVGCGNGIITNILAEKYDVTGTDFSASALEFVKGKKVLASADNLPFEDRSFDLVFSSELLEHLPKDVLDKAMAEMRRITKGYVFLTVPNNEFLQKDFTKCPKCKTTFHVYGHLNSFNIQTLDNTIGPSFKRYMKGAFGPKEKKYNSFLLKIRQRIADRWFSANENTICPNCGNREFPKQKGNILSKLCNGLNLIISGKQKYWLFAFYDRNELI
jgi:ubiquinone/menaquinone biosynthesis C-methylase UbiE